ncbi:MAG: hypothetical protein IPH53_06025 [Flavobacteriales bacterium]|nr:hypothetical protein [Flavobacteriales bacterium]
MFSQQATGLALAPPQPFFDPLPGDTIISYQFLDIDGDDDADLLTTAELVPGGYVDVLRVHINTNGNAANIGKWSIPVVGPGWYHSIWMGTETWITALNAHASLYVLKQQFGG